jgi:Subtilase family/PA domain/Peptidase inhibitor I9
MRTRRPRDPIYALPLAFLAAVTTLVLIAAGGRGAEQPLRPAGASWKGLAGEQRPRIAVGQRMIVVLKAPSLADRVGEVGGLVTSEQERSWNSSVLGSQKLLISRLGVQGVVVQPEYSYTRVINGFSAAFDANGLAVLERAPEVAGVFPVRAAYPASRSATLVPTAAYRPLMGLSDRDGRGIRIALLDTGVDRAQPFLRGRVAGGIDIVGGDADVGAAPKPDDPSELERHGTEMAGLLVGSGGPGALAGVAPGATVVPIRVAGWQRDASAEWAVYGRTDQILAGLERAVDPNGDGDAHDAAGVALVALAEPFAGFTDGPMAKASAGATRLNTLVVTAAGNDGPKGPGYGSISGPGGAPAALTVGAADLRPDYGEVRVVIRSGLTVLLDRLRPLASAIAPRFEVDVGVGIPRRRSTAPQRRSAAVPLLDFFDQKGLSLVAGKAALVRVGSDPADTVANAARAGAVAVLFYGANLPAGAIGLDESASIPVVSIPTGTAETLLARLAEGAPVTASVGAARTAANTSEDRVARFSSTGLAYDGRVKPELVAPGVSLGTAEPGANPDGSARFATVSGTSAAAAIAAGAAALLAQARPELDAAGLKSVLVASARPLPEDDVMSQGAGLVDLGGAAASEVQVDPSSLAFGRATGPSWSGRQTVVLKNLSVRRVRLELEMRVGREGAAALDFRVRPSRLSLAAGHSIRIHVRARVTSALDGTAPASGALVVTPLAGRELRIPWAIAFGRQVRPVLSSVRLSHRRFRPSDATPALLTFVAGSVEPSGEGEEVRPLARLDLELLTSDGESRGRLATLRDVLPGRYSFGVTGRDPAGSILPTGDYVLRLVAYPTVGGPPTRRAILFSIK